MWVTHGPRPAQRNHNPRKALAVRPPRAFPGEPWKGIDEAESGTTSSAALWPQAKPLLNVGHTYCMSPVFDCSWYIKQCLFAFYLERVNSMATTRFADIIMFDKKA